MTKQPEILVQDIDHLGIIAGIIDEMGLVEEIDRQLGTPQQQQVSAGQVVKAMILNGLGFVSAPLYLFEQFFTGKATEHLLGEGVRPEQGASQFCKNKETPIIRDYSSRIMRRFNPVVSLSGGDNPLKRLVELAIHPLESSKNLSLLTGLLRMGFGVSLLSIMIIIRVGEGGRGTPRPPSRRFFTIFWLNCNRFDDKYVG